MRAKEDRWRTLTHLAPVGIVETDAAGRCVFANDWVSELTGRAARAAVRLGLARRPAPGRPRRLRRGLARGGRGGAGEFSLEARFVAPEGAVRWVHLTAVLLRDPWEAPAGWLGTLVDVTPARQAREDLRQAERELRRQQEACSPSPRSRARRRWPTTRCRCSATAPARCCRPKRSSSSMPGAAPEAGVLEEPVVGGGVLRARWPAGSEAPDRPRDDRRRSCWRPSSAPRSSGGGSSAACASSREPIR